MKALTFSSFGGSEVLEYIDVPNPVLKEGELLVQMKAIGLNFADIYRRKGNYHLKGQPPLLLVMKVPVLWLMPISIRNLKFPELRIL